jgi:Zn-dependent protease with chaperone function
VTAGVAGWILTYAFHSAVLCLIAALVVRTARTDASQRCLILRGALFLPFVTASLAFGASARLLAAGTFEITTPIRRILPPRLGSPRVELHVLAIDGRPPARVVTVHDPFGRAASIGLIVLAAGSAFAGIAMIRRRNRFIRSALRGRTSLPVEIPAAAMRDVRISTSASLCVPVALRRREICIPASTFSGLGSVERESIILHEIAHVERNDPLWLDASRLV